MPGLSSLIRFFRKIVAPSIEETGLLPGRYYLNFTLDALAEGDVDEAVRLLKLYTGSPDSPRFRLVLQQVVFKLRSLRSAHLKHLESLEEESAMIQDGPLIERYAGIRAAALKAVSILARYEEELLEL